MENPREELRTLIQATRALIEYTREGSPEGAVIIKSPSPVREAPLVKALERSPVAPSPAVEPMVEPMVEPGEAPPASQIGFKELFASLGPEAPKPALKAPKPEPAKGPLSKAKIVEVHFETRMKHQNELEEIAKQARACVKCRLCETRRSVVWGVGPAFAPLMFIGEGPGENEDRQGIPFVGAAGQLLTKIITATGFSREDAYIANCVNCRPPNNRNPEPDELSACWPYLHKQIELVSPKVIVTLGKFAAQALLNTQDPISRLRGVVKRYNDIPVIPTFHPAYLLRNPADKRLVWEDMQAVRRVYDEMVG